MTNQEMITLTYDNFITPTTKAFLITFGDEKIWLPQSLTEIDESDNTLEIPLWLAEEKGVENYEY